MTVQDLLEALLGQSLLPTSESNPWSGPHNCFCHEDVDHPSMSIRLDNGVWKCHATDRKGNLTEAVSLIKGVAYDEAATWLTAQGVVKQEIEVREQPEKEPIAEEIVASFVRKLNADKDRRAFATNNFGWEPETMKLREIGWASESERYTIPVRDSDGLVRNVRLYSPHKRGVEKMISFKEGYGRARLYPIDSLGARTIYVCEGEKDSILLGQYLARWATSEGAAAITGTGGAGSWRDAWCEMFKDKDVVFVYDIDDKGRQAAMRNAAKLLPYAKSVKVVTLDISEPPNGDITDYFVAAGKGWDDFRRLVEETELFTPATKIVPPEHERDPTVYTPHLSRASENEFLYKRLDLKVMLAGKSITPYAAPKRVAWNCWMNLGNQCAGCAMSQRNGYIEREIEEDDPLLLRMIKVPDEERNTALKKAVGIYSRCSLVEQEVLEWRNVEECAVVPEIDFADEDLEYVSRTAFILQHGVQANKGYVMHATALPHPKTQQVIHLVPKIDPAQDNIDDFAMDENKAKLLQVFQVQKGQTVHDKMQEIAHDLSLNVTRIFGREDLITAIDLCFHTVLGFSFQDHPVAKAWGDVLIIGDTRTGKTETVQHLIAHYKLGEMAIGENSSVAGLMGGLKQTTDRQWQLIWGRIPLNNRRLLVIDELSGLESKDIGQLSGIRSNGVAELTKIQSQRTMARTRLISVSNPRADKSLSEHNHGVEAVKELIGRPEDIARFDFVVSAATNEVDIEEINALRHAEVAHVYTSDLCRTLLLWTWSRTPDKIVFTEGATRRVLELAIEQSRRYSSSGGIPLVEGGNHRIKLSKLAVATACRLFSTEDGEHVLVTEHHVEFAAAFLDQIYSKSSLDYAGWSRNLLEQLTVPEASMDAATDWIGEHPEWAELFAIKSELRLDDLKSSFDMETKEVRAEITAPLKKWKMIDQTKQGTIIKQPAFSRLLKERFDEIKAGVAQGMNGSAPSVVTEDNPDAFPF